MKRTTIAYLLVTILGVVLMAVALLDIWVNLLPTAVSDVISHLGALGLALGVAGLARQDLLQSDPVLQQREKALNDERNTAIRCRAEAWAGNVTVYLLALGGLVSTAFDAPKWITWTLVGIVVFNLLLRWVFTLWLRRRM